MDTTTLFEFVSDRQAEHFADLLESTGLTQEQAKENWPNLPTNLVIQRLRDLRVKNAQARDKDVMPTEQDDDDAAVTIWMARNQGLDAVANALQSVVDTLPDRALLVSKTIQARRRVGRPTAADWHNFRGTGTAHEIPETLTALGSDGVGIPSDLDGIRTETF